jgi:hypothetical protein
MFSFSCDNSSKVVGSPKRDCGLNLQDVARVAPSSIILHVIHLTLIGRQIYPLSLTENPSIYDNEVVFRHDFSKYVQTPAESSRNTL